MNALPDNVFVEIFSLCRIGEVGRGTWNHRPWKWHRLAHVCRTWRQIMFTSTCRLRLELLCTHETPVRKNLGYLPAFPIVISFFDHYFRNGDRDSLLAALEHRDRVRVVEITIPDTLFEELAMVMQEPFPALTHLRLNLDKRVAMPNLPDTFLGGSAPRLETIYIAGISFPAAPTLLSSACDLVHVDLRRIPPSGYIPPDAMVASLAALPKLKYLTLGFVWCMSHRGRMHLPSITRTVLPSLTRFSFDGSCEYFEDFVAQIDAPQLGCLYIEYLDEDDVTGYQISQLCQLVDRTEQFKPSRFRRADLTIEPHLATVELVRQGQSSFRLSIHEDAICQVVNRLSALLSNVDLLFIRSDISEYEELGEGLRWLELFRPFTAVKALSIDDELSNRIHLPLESVTGESAAEVLPALQLLYIADEPMLSMMQFVVTRQNTGRPVTVVNEKWEFQVRLDPLEISEHAYIL